MKTHLTFILVCIALLSVQLARADAPSLLPVQGYLTDARGKPVDGNLAIRFRLYSSSVADEEKVVFEEVRDVSLSGGHFTVYLGDGSQKLDLQKFAQYGTLYVGLKINDDAQELSPLLQLATAPYAAFAQFCGDATTLGNLGAEEYLSRDSTVSAAQFSAYEDLGKEGKLDGKDGDDLVRRDDGDGRFARLSQCYWKGQDCGTSSTCVIKCDPGSYVISGGCDGAFAAGGDPSFIMESFPAPSDGKYKESPFGPWHPGTKASDPKFPVVDAWVCKVKSGYLIDNAYAFCCPGI
jgi:hypothetical protein